MLVYLVVAVKVDKAHVAGTEIVLVHTVVAKHVESGGSGLLACAEHSVGDIAVEHVGRLANLSADGSTIDR